MAMQNFDGIQQAPGQALMNIQQGASATLGSALTKIQPLQSSRIQQKRKLLEAVTCLEQQNMYVLYAGETTDTPIFWVQENSSCIQRNCLPPDCAPWDLSYHNIGHEGLEEGNSGKHFPEFMRVTRPCSFTFCCLNRPEAVIKEMPSERQIGVLRDPFSLCNFTFQVKDAQGTERLNTKPCCCQLGTFCRCPGLKVGFPILDSGDDHQMATITKIWTCGDICPLCAKDWSNIVIDFGEASNSDYKLLLIALGNFIQLRLFDARNEG